LFGPKGAEIGTYRATFVYQGPFKKDASTGSRVINEVVLGTSVNKGKKRNDRARRRRRRRSGVLVENKDSGPPFGQDESLLL
jgi:hypothetical protein